MKTSEAVVYWIRLAHHTDINNDGYIGVTKNYLTRMNRHITHTIKLNTHFGNAIKAYTWGNLVKEIIFTGNIQECFDKEFELRNIPNTGWNEAIGGFGGDRSNHINYDSIAHKGWNYDRLGIKNSFFGKHHSLSTKLNLAMKRAKLIITTPDGLFYGIRATAKFYNINRITAKKWASKKEGWSIENITSRD